MRSVHSQLVVEPLTQQGQGQGQGLLQLTLQQLMREQLTQLGVLLPARMKDARGEAR